MRARLARWLRDAAERLDPAPFTITPDPRSGGHTVSIRASLGALPLARIAPGQITTDRSPRS